MNDDDNPTIGIILCSQKNEAIVKYSVLNDTKQVFASKYRLTLPTAEELNCSVRSRRKDGESKNMKMQETEEACAWMPKESYKTYATVLRHRCPSSISAGSSSDCRRLRSGAASSSTGSSSMCRLAGTRCLHSLSLRPRLPRCRWPSWRRWQA